MNIVRKQGAVEGFTEVDLELSSHIVFTDYESYFPDEGKTYGYAFVSNYVGLSAKEASAFLITNENKVYVLQLNGLGGYHYTHYKGTQQEFMDLIDSIPTKKVVFHVQGDNQL